MYSHEISVEGKVESFLRYIEKKSHAELSDYFSELLARKRDDGVSCKIDFKNLKVQAKKARIKAMGIAKVVAMKAI